MLWEAPRQALKDKTDRGGRVDVYTGGRIATEECQSGFLHEPLPPPSEPVGGVHLSYPPPSLLREKRGDGQTKDVTEKVESMNVKRK